MLDRINKDRFDRGNDQAQRSAVTNLEFILARASAFNYIRNGKKYLMDAKDLLARNKKYKEPFTPAQLSYIDGLYEKFWTGTSKAKNDDLLAGCEVKHDNKKY